MMNLKSINHKTIAALVSVKNTIIKKFCNFASYLNKTRQSSYHLSSTTKKSGSQLQQIVSPLKENGDNKNESGNSIEFNIRTLLSTCLQKGNLDELKPNDILVDAHLSGFIYDKDTALLNQLSEKNQSGRWEVNSELISKIAMDLGMQCIINDEKSMFIDEKTGLTATLLTNKKTKEICISFGGTTSGQESGKLIKRNINNAGITVSQWATNAKNIFSHHVPEAYMQAFRLTKKIKSDTENQQSFLHQYKLKITGHSLGAALASFAAAMAGNPHQPITANCFSSAELGTAALREIYIQHNHSPENIKKVVLSTIHIRVRGDIIPLISKLNLTSSVKGLTLLGTTFTIPKAPNKIETHDNYRYHIQQWAIAQQS